MDEPSVKPAAGEAAPPLSCAEGGEALRERIRRFALDRGLAACRFARAGPIPHAAALRDFLAGGRHAGMGWMARTAAVRLDPRVRFPWARTVVVVALAQDGPPDAPADGVLRGRIAAYAAGSDYHARLEGPLRAMADEVRRLAPGAEARYYVDHGPVADREQAFAAGLGTYGKNTMLLARDLGSHFQIGEVLTSLDLPPDEPHEEDLCRGCTACLDACPTGALVAPRVLDARLCISYLTIEHRGSIPPDLRERMGTWVFGCDACQDACPWNTGAARSWDAEAAFPDLLELAALSDESFRARYRGSAVLRAKREGLVRNACVALGNARDARAIPPLARLLAGDPSAVVRAHAAWALSRIGGPAARAALAAAAAGDPDPAVRAEAASVGGRRPNPEAP